jgi:hypothetical protein
MHKRGEWRVEDQHGTRQVMEMVNAKELATTGMFCLQSWPAKLPTWKIVVSHRYHMYF